MPIIIPTCVHVHICSSRRAIGRNLEIQYRGYNAIYCNTVSNYFYFIVTDLKQFYLTKYKPIFHSVVLLRLSILNL